MAYTNPSTADFVQYFFRDFPYGTDPNTSVTTVDITNAMQMTNMEINQCFWMDQGSYNVGYLLLTAHFMVLNLRSSSQGINGQYNFLQVSKSAGGISESTMVPPQVQNNPLWSMYTKTNYGSTYLGLLLPNLVGITSSVWGGTNS